MFAQKKSSTRIARRVAGLQLICLAVVSCCPAMLEGQGRTEILAASGQAVPGGNGTFNFFEGIHMNAVGEVSFLAGLAATSGGASDNAGIYRANGSGTIQIVRAGQSAPGGNGVFSSLSVKNTLNDLGQLAFYGVLTGTSGGSNDNSGIFRGDGTSLVQIARRGQTAPDLNGAFASFNNPVLNQSGHTAFHATLSGTSGGLNDNTGVYRGDGGGPLVQIAREGQAAPDGNGVLSSFGPVSINNAGTTAFRATMTGTSGGTSDYSGIFAGSGGGLTQIVRGNQAAPGGNGVFADFNFSNSQSFNNAGQAAFYAVLSGTSGGTTDDRGVYRSSGGTATQIAREGQAAPDSNGLFADFGSISLNDAGQVAFHASLSGTSNGSNDNSGVFRGSGGAITQIAREGQLVADGNGTYGVMSQVSIGGAGQVLFQSNLSGTAGGFSDNLGLYVGDGTDLLQVIREGDALAGSSVLGFLVEVSGATNPYGQIAYRAQLANGNEIVNRWTPELHWRGTASSTWDTNGRWTLGLDPALVHDVFIDPAASLTVTGPATSRTVRSLQVGGGNGLATLDLRNGATLTALNGISIESTGTLSGDGSLVGSVANRGTIIADNLVFANTLTNHNLLRGNGRVHAPITNANGGEIRAGIGDSLWLSGPGLSNQNGGRIRALNGGQIEVTGNSFSNSGMIEIHDGAELKSIPRLANQAGTGLISLRDGSLVGNGGITNAGSIAMTLGNSTIQGDISNTGIIQVSGGAHATFFDDMIQNGTLQVASVGNTTSTAVFLGAFTGGGGFVGGGDVFALGDLRPGNSPASVLYDGNLFLGSSTSTWIELGGLDPGSFDQMIVTGDLNLAGDLFVSLLGTHSLGFGEQYQIADIGGSLVGQFNGLSEGALVGVFGGRELFITYGAGDGNGIALFTAIPEPGAGILLAAFAGIVLARRRRPVGRVCPLPSTGQVRRIVPTGLVMGLLMLASTANAQPTITNLGTLTNGSLSIANGISADGTTVTGYSNNGQFTSARAFRWTSSGGMQDLGVLPSYSSSIGYAVSADGSTIVGGGSGFQHAWRWSAGTGMTDLGTLPGGGNSTALGISADGDLITGWSHVSGGMQRPFVWSSSAGMSEISLLPGGNAGQAAAVSGDGMYFAGRSTFAGSGSGTNAVRWGPNGLEDLGALVSGGSSYATAISHDGSVVVGVTPTSNGSRAFRWTEATGMVNLGIVPPAGTFPQSHAYAVSGDGLTIGGVSNNDAFLWRAELGMVDLATWLQSEGINTSGWRLANVSGLSYDGSIITGTGFFNNQQRAWIVNMNSAVPEPGMGLLVAFAAIATTIRRGRRSWNPVVGQTP